MHAVAGMFRLTSQSTTIKCRISVAFYILLGILQLFSVFLVLQKYPRFQEVAVLCAIGRSVAKCLTH